MKLKKILLPIFIGVTLVMASVISVVSGMYEGTKYRTTNKVSVGLDLNDSLMQENPVSATESIENMFEITTYNDLEYTGEAQTIVEITPLSGRVYYRVESGEYNSSHALNSTNYSNYLSGAAGEKVSIQQTDAGTYTVYYYIPANGDYNEISSSATVSIINTKESNLFEIKVYENLTYNGTAQTLMEITPLTGTVYYYTHSGEYNKNNAINSTNYTNYSSGTAGSTVSVKETNAGTYTIYYYIPANDDYSEVASSATITIKNATVNVTIDPNGGSWNGSSENSTITQYVGSSYSIAAPTSKTGYHVSGWSGGDTILQPVALKNEVKTFDGDDYINLGREYMYTDKLFISIEAYMDNWAQYPTSKMILISCTAGGGWQLASSGGKVAVSIYDDGAKEYKRMYTTYPWASLSSGWHTFILTFDGDYARIYIDGQLIHVSEEFIGNIGYNKNNSIIVGVEAGNTAGSIDPANGQYFTGKIRNVYIANTCVSADSVTSLTPTDSQGYPFIHIATGIGDKILTAQWEANTYEVVFNAKGATGSMENQIFTYGVNQALRTVAYSKENCEFVGWTTVDYDLETMPAIEYNDGHEISTPLTAENNGKVTLYAIWSGVGYIARVYIMNVNGSYPTGYTTQIMDGEAGTTITLATEALKLTDLDDGGIEFDYAKDTDGNIIEETTIKNNHGTIVCFYLARVAYTLTFNANGGTVTPSSVTLRYEQAYGDMPTPTREGYTFDVWSTLLNGGQEVTSTTTMGKENVTLYATWTPISYTITFDANGGTVTPESKTVTYDSTYDILPTPVRTGYTFEGWGINLFDYETMTLSNSSVSADGVISLNDGTYDRILNKSKWTPKTSTTYYIVVDIITNTFNDNLNLRTDSRFYFNSLNGKSSQQITVGQIGRLIVEAVTYDNFDDVTLGSLWFYSNNKDISGEFTCKIYIYEKANYNITSETQVTTAGNHTLIANWSVAMPTITISASQTEIGYNTSDVVLTAVAVHDFEKTYQWYRGTSSGFTPDSSTLIEGATGETYIHSKSLSGNRHYYKCVVTVANNLSATSNEIAITVSKSENLFQVIVDNSLQYNGEDQVLLEVVDSDGIDDNVYYSIGTALTESNYLTDGSTSLPIGKLAKEYQVYFYVPESDMYNEIIGKVIVQIAKKQNVFELNTIPDIIYDGQAHVLVQVTDSDDIENNVYYSIGTKLTAENYKTAGSTSLPTGTNVAEYKVYFYVPESDNYYEMLGSVIVNISKLANQYQVIISENLVYNGQAQVLLEVIDSDNISNNIYYSIGTELTESNYKAEGKTALPTAIESGTYTVYYYSPNSANYDGFNGYAEVLIDNRETTLTINPNGGYWCGNENNSVFTKVNGSTLIIENPVRLGYTFTNWTLSAECLFENGVYTFDINNVTLTANWQAIAPTVTISADKDNITYGIDNTTLTAIVNHELEVTYQWYRSTISGFTPAGDNIINDATSESYTHNATEVNAGIYYYRCIISSPNGLTVTSNQIKIIVNKRSNLFELTVNQDLVYNGTAQTLLSVIDSDGIDNNVYYNIGIPLTADNYQTTGKTTLPTKTNAGNYTVYFYVPETDNYKSIIGVVEVRIDKAENTFELETYNDLVYNGQEQVLAKVIDNDGIDNNVYYSITTELTASNYKTDGSTELPTAINSGNYEIYFYVPASDNYNELSGHTETEIGVKYTTLTIDPNGGTWKGSSEISEFTEGDGTTLEIEEPVRPGYGFVRWILSAEAIFENGVYTFDVNDVTLTADWGEVAPIILITTTSNNLVYGTDMATLTAVADHELPMTYQWYRDVTSGFIPSDQNAITDATDTTYIHNASETVVGKYYYKCIVTTSNDISATSNEIEIVVSAAENTLVVNVNEGLIYNGEAQELLTVVDNDGIDNNIYYAVGTELTSSNYETAGSVALPTGINAGQYIVYFYVPESDNYKAISGTATAKIDKKDNSFTINPVQDLKYNGQAQVLVEVVDNDESFKNVYYSIGTELTVSNYETAGSVALPTGINAGQYIVYFYIPETTNFNEISGQETVEIAKAENIFTVDIAQGLIYTGETYVLATVTDSDGIDNNVYYCIGTPLTESNYKTDGSTELPKASEAGDYEVYFYAPSSDNYKELISCVEVSITIKYTTLTVDLNGGTWSNENTTFTQSYGTTVEITNPTRDGFTFDEWVLEGGGSFENGVFTFGDSNATLTAQWKGVEYTITIVGGDGEAPVLNYTSSTTEDQSVSFNEVAKTGYTFNGWSITTNTSAIDSTIGDTVSESGQYILTIPAGAYGNIEITASFEPISYTVIYNGNGNDNDVTMSPSEHEYDKPQKLSKNIYIKTGYLFLGWATNDSAAEATFVDEQEVDNLTSEQDAEVTLYAVWQASEITVTFNANGGTVDPASKKVTYDSAYGELPTPERDGYTFEGWSTNNLYNVGTLDDYYNHKTFFTISGDTITGKNWSGSSAFITNSTYYPYNHGETYIFSFDATHSTRIYMALYDANKNNISSTLSIDGLIYNQYFGDGSLFKVGNELTININNENIKYFRVGFATYDLNFDDETLITLSNIRLVKTNITENTIVTISTNHTLIANWKLNANTITLDYKGGTENLLYTDSALTNSISGTFETDDEKQFTLDQQTKFNKSNSLKVDKTDITFKVPGVSGKYKVSAYVYGSGNLGVFVQETNNFELIATKSIALNNVWTYISIEFTVSTEVTYLNLILNASETAYVDDIKVIRTDAYTPETTFNYTVEDTAVKLPYAVKAGYTFLGWYANTEGTGEPVTTYGGGQIGDATYYAIYTLSNPTATVTVDNATITYSELDATLTASIYTEGLTIDSVTYQWYRNEVKIEGENNATYIHKADALDVGTYTYYCVVTTTKDGVTSSEIASNSITVTVQQADSLLEIEMGDYTYNGEIATPTATKNISGAQVTFYYNTTNSTIGGTEWNNMNSTSLNAGTYYMYATTPATTNYKAAISEVVEFTINTATIEIETRVDEGTNKEQNGYNFILTSDLDTDGIKFEIGPTNVDATITYWIGEDGEKTSVLLAQNELQTFIRNNAGKDTYNYTITADNYTAIQGTIELSIAVQTVEVKWNGIDNTYTYDGTDQSSKITAYIEGVDGNIDCEIAFTIEGIEAEFKNAGTYTVTATLSSEHANNYTLTNSSKTVVINKFDVTITAENKEMIYGESAPVYTSSEPTTPDSYEVTFNIYNLNENDVTGTESTLDTGVYKITPSSTLSTDNYNITYVSGVLTVNAKELTIPTISGSYTYNGNEQTVELTNFDEETMEIVSGNTGTDAGTYTVEIKLTDSNYTWSDGTTANITLDWVIDKFDLSNATIGTIEQQPFTGSEITPTPEVTTDFATLTNNEDFTYSYSNNINATTEAVVTITAVEDSNYTGTKSAYFTIAGAFVTAPTTSGTYIYNATEQTVTLTGFDSSTMEIVSGNTGTDAGTYTVEIKLKDSVNYTWKLEDGSTSKDNQKLGWEIEKANVELALEKTSIIARVGETITNKATLTLSYLGNLTGDLTISEHSDSSIITVPTITDNTSIITIVANKGTDSNEEITITYPGDKNHNEVSATFTLAITTIKVEIIVANDIGGSGTISGIISGTTDEVKLDSEITFTATPDTNYGLIKYIVGANGNAIYRSTVNTNETLTSVFESDAIKVTDDLLTDTNSDNIKDKLTIILYFEEVVVVEMNIDSINITHEIVTKYENNEVAHIYDDNLLTVFKNSTIELDLTAEYNETEGQHYVVNKVVIGEETTTPNLVGTKIIQDVTNLVGEDGKISPISIQAAKVYKADSRTITEESENIATVEVIVDDINNSVTIDKAKYIVENSSVNIVITETNSNYDFLGINVNGTITLKDQLNKNDWTQNGNVRTWTAQGFTEGLSTMTPVMLERWYEVDNTNNRTVEVTVSGGVTAKLVNTDIGYSYTLATDIFKQGEDPLYAGDWKVVIESATGQVSNYVVTIQVYKKDSDTPDEYGKDDKFTVDSNVTKVVISITNQTETA